MKVTLNLAIPASAHERYALYWAIPATLLGVIGLAFLLLFTVRSFREYRGVRASVAGYQERENALRAQETALRRQLEEPQSGRLLHDVQVVNALIEGKRISLTGLATDITGLIPDEVQLTTLALAPDGQELAVRFVITGKSEEAVERFLSNLEDSPHFKDVAIINEGGFEEAGASSELENIALTAHYLVGGSESSGE
jgi:Tfp pilus assembly protein PilN